MLWKIKFSFRRIFLFAFNVFILALQLLLWPACEELDSSSLMEDLETDDLFDLAPLPSNPLDPPMWSHDPHHASGSCGSWQKSYTHMHRAMLSGELPPSYLVYTTGQGFPPVIEGVPEAMKGIATVFTLALLTERAFLLDWKSPSGLSRVLTPRYIDWRHDAHFGEDNYFPNPIPHVHDIGSKNWFRNQNKSISFYTDTDFNSYFSREKEIIQSHSYDFTYALIRNKHFRKKARELGLDNMKCRLCCIWHYLFKHVASFERNLASIVSKRLHLTPNQDFIFVDLSLPSKYESLPWNIVKQHTEQVFSCVGKISTMLGNPACVVASNSYQLLEKMGTFYPAALTNNGLFFTRERYQTELYRQLNTTAHELAKHHLPSSIASGSNVTIPRTEHNALMYYFMGYYLQLNSTVLFTSRRSMYSESMAALRHYYHPTSSYLVRPEGDCKLEKYL